ncbi:conserved hypothetical protein [Candidatus Methylobacter favarea]|uniref:Uncharacterized protein n=1 Tax=Candidatus Methylobacter favarea TaxID=2707345 RepID=A0A8S0WLM1_9GAMM|nr:hypothetical protein [Candidatus Methylobacter favarea]CAA9889290.1 conserved hypothetical protein [Candidatus Methylobacter favarea]
MSQEKSYLKGQFGNAVSVIVKGIDHDVEKGEDLLMLGFGTIMLSSTFAPVAPPIVLLPLVALTFAVSAGLARRNYYNMQRKLAESMALLDRHEKALLYPIAAVFADHPINSLAESYNPFKNLKRTIKSALGGFLINPLWMPIFYMMGIQINEEKNLGILNRAIIGVEQKLFPKRVDTE